MYRVMVFFWILAGLTWLGGVVSMLTDLLNLSVSYQFDFALLKNNMQFPIIFQRILPRRTRDTNGNSFQQNGFEKKGTKVDSKFNQSPDQQVETLLQTKLSSKYQSIENMVNQKSNSHIEKHPNPR
jgi:hypothetical protein